MDEPVYAPDHAAVLASLEAMASARRGWESLRDECYQWQKVRDSIDPGAASNVGQRYLCWLAPGPSRKGGRYQMSIHHPRAGRVVWAINAPLTLKDAGRKNALLDKAILRRDQTLSALVADYGEVGHVARRDLSLHLRAVLQCTPEGRDRLARTPSALNTIGKLIRTADAYDRADWSPKTGRNAHMVLRNLPNRVALVAAGIESDQARIVVKESEGQKREEQGPNPFRPVGLPQKLRLELRRAYVAGCTRDQIIEEWKAIQREEERGSLAKAA